GETLGHRRDPHSRLEPLLDRRGRRRALPQGRGAADARQGILPAMAHPRAELSGGRAGAADPRPGARAAGGKVPRAGGEADRDGAGSERGRYARAHREGAQGQALPVTKGNIDETAAQTAPRTRSARRQHMKKGILIAAGALTVALVAGAAYAAMGRHGDGVKMM